MTAVRVTEMVTLIGASLMSKPPSKGDFWRAFAAVTILPISGTDKAVLGCLVDFANSETGACWPGQNTIARATGKDIRAVKRSIQNLIKTPYLKRRQRYRASTPDFMSTQLHHTSNLYEIGWDALLQAFDAYKQRRSRPPVRLLARQVDCCLCRAAVRHPPSRIVVVRQRHRGSNQYRLRDDPLSVHWDHQSPPPRGAL